MKYLILCLLGLSLSSCATGYMPFSDKEQAWYIKHEAGHDDKVFYCKANSNVKGEVPQCFESDMKNINTNAQVGIL